MSTPAVIEHWLDDLPARQPEITCPACGGAQFTLRRTGYGTEAACLTCPTYIGIRHEPPATTGTPKTRNTRHLRLFMLNLE